MLSHHPDIAFPGEFDLSVERIEKDGSLPDLADYHEWLRVHRHFLGHNLQIDPSLAYHELVRSFLATMKLEKGGRAKPYVGAAIHWNFEHLPSLWPAARFIHLLRDPRDVCASIMAMGWAGNHYVGARDWREAEESWDRLKSRISPRSWIEIRFEELARDTQATLIRLCEFIGVPYSSEMLAYSEHSTYERVDPDVAQRWRRTQSPREIQLGEAGAGVLLERRGYGRSRYPALTVGPAYQRYLELQSRIATLRFRIKRYGFGLWMELRVSRTLGIKAWHASATLRAHEITNRHLQ